MLNTDVILMIHDPIEPFQAIQVFVIHRIVPREQEVLKYTF